MNEVILILGGTKEASELAESLVHEKPKARVISSLAGRTKEPAPVLGEVRIGGFGGADGLARFITQNEVTQLIDATHPFAKNISKNARLAAAMTEVSLAVRQRQPWKKQPGDHWIEVADLETARDAIPAASRVLLALGSQYIAAFASRSDVHFIIRMVDEPSQALPFDNFKLELGKPGDLSQET
ncbi:MAG: precorrin-6A/cobalt-precorrin-6A reductase, partial [Pseudomonadota bacterium]